MKAICIEDVYSRRGQTILSSPSFVKGKTYNFEIDTWVGHMELPGDFKAVNERGVITILSAGMFRRHFILDDYTLSAEPKDWVMD